jgi:hypothetical protein
MKTIWGRQLVWVGAFAFLLICSCSQLDKGQSPVYASKNQGLDVTVCLQNIPKKVEREIPELRLLSMEGGVPSHSQVWRGKEYARFVYVLRNKTRYHPVGEFPRATKPVPYMDIEITVTRFNSPKDAHDGITKEMRSRQATPRPKESYRGAWLYRFTSGGGTVICESGQYVIEINPNSEAARPFTLGLLDVALAQIKHVLIKSN